MRSLPVFRHPAPSPIKLVLPCSTVLLKAACHMEYSALCGVKSHVATAKSPLQLLLAFALFCVS